jgi:hypothetical protein
MVSAEQLVLKVEIVDYSPTPRDGAWLPTSSNTWSHWLVASLANWALFKPWLE